MNSTENKAAVKKQLSEVGNKSRHVVLKQNNQLKPAHPSLYECQMKINMLLAPTGMLQEEIYNLHRRQVLNCRED